MPGWKLDTEETSKQEKLKQREPPWKWQVQKIKTLCWHQLHRKGPIDLEKYKLDQETIWKWTDPTLPTTIPEKVLDIFLLFYYDSLFFEIFKSSITPLILIFITYYYFAKKKRPYFLKVNFIYIYLIIFVTFFSFFSFFSLILYFWSSKLYSRFLIFAFWYLLSILYL